MNLEIYKTQHDLITALAETICKASKKAIATRKQFNFVLSGGHSPQKLYELLASKTYQNKIDWKKTYFFFGDERFVPEGDSQRNSLMADKTLFRPCEIAESHIFKVNTSGTPEEAASQYAESIHKHFQGKPIEFDFILLGLGENAHTASLFPYSPVLRESEATIKSIFVKEVDMYRITMTAPLLNQGRQIVFLVFGKDKAKAVYQVLEDNSGSSEQYPARFVTSDKKKVTWFLDTTAASQLYKKPSRFQNL